jgi:enolase
MNHAAETAAAGAVDIFVDAVKKMTLSDAVNILHGPDNAATAYFEKNTRTRLYGVFFPVIKNAMDKVGVTKLYKFLIDKYNTIPFIQKKTYDLDRYITDRGLDGLFYMLASEEKKIRKDPAARVTELLRKVFG